MNKTIFILTNIITGEEIISTENVSDVRNILDYVENVDKERLGDYHLHVVVFDLTSISLLDIIRSYLPHDKV